MIANGTAPSNNECVCTCSMYACMHASKGYQLFGDGAGVSNLLLGWLCVVYKKNKRLNGRMIGYQNSLD